MSEHYQDFGLNTFIYEPNGADPFQPNGSIGAYEFEAGKR